MSGWRPSSSVCGMAAGCAAVLPDAVVRLVPYSSHCGAGEYCSSCRAVFLARCCGVRAASACPCCSCVGVSSVRRPPLVVVEGGVVVDGGWHCVGRAVVLLAPRRMLASPSVRWRPPSACGRLPCRSPCGPVEWRGVVCCDALSSDRVRHLVLFYSLLYCSVPLPSLCSLSQHCWFGVVSL